MALYALVLAGGSGERFWPLSRRTRPKQLLSIFSGETLLEGTLRRLQGVVPFERIFLLTNEEQEKAVRALIPSIPSENIIAEPAKRDTAAAIALGVGLIARHDPTATMVVLPADQLIEDVDSFQRTLQAATIAAEESESLVTIGIKPTWPCTFFGYIEEGRQITVRDLGPGAPVVREVLRFREKPATELAESFIRDGNFRWNAGMFVWTVPAILREFGRHVPALAEFIARLHSAATPLEVVREEFGTLPRVSIDYAIMEKTSQMLVIEAEFDWDDVGNWIAASKYWERDADGNASNVELSTVDATNNIVFSDPSLMQLHGTPPMRVGLVGVDDIIVVQTRDAILICNRHEADKIKHLVAKLPRDRQ